MFSDKVDLVRADFIPGRTVGVITAGRPRSATVICFEVAYDTLVRDAVRGGADLLVVQTNNATFGYTDESVQQLAMSRIRAVETGRAVVHISTVGVSALIMPDGSEVARSEHFTRQVLRARLPLRTGQTIATRVGAIPEGALAAVGLLLTGWGGYRTAERSPPPTNSFHDGTLPESNPGRRTGAAAVTGPTTPGRVLVIVPTYNERENLPLIVARVRGAVPSAHVLVADDASPDGTGQLADHLAPPTTRTCTCCTGRARPGWVRPTSTGSAGGPARLRRAGRDGRRRLAPARAAASLLERVHAGADVVLGSRYVPGGSVVNWPKHREMLSRGGNLYSGSCSGSRYMTPPAATGPTGPPPWRNSDSADVESQGYCFQVDLARRAIQAGLRVDEVPITFVERTLGASKMNRAIIVEALWRVTRWGIRSRIEQLINRRQRALPH